MEGQASKEILHIDFNQDKSHFTIGTQSGFYIYNVDNNQCSSQELGGGIGMIEMNYKTNILALVGGGKNPKFPSNKLILWDDHTKKCAGELTFPSPIKSIKIRKDKLAIILENKICVHDFRYLKFLETIATGPNPKGLCVLDYNDICNFCVCPDKEIGKVLLFRFDQTSNNQIKIFSHESALGMLELSPDGKLLATASEKGTIIRIISLSDKRIVKQFKRGFDRALIYNIAFDSTCQWLACTSDSGTIHVYSLKTREASALKHESKSGALYQNPKSKLAGLLFFIPYFSHELTFAYAKIMDFSKPYKIAFKDPQTIVVVSYENTYSLGSIPKNGGLFKLKREAIKELTNNQHFVIKVCQIDELNKSSTSCFCQHFILVHFYFMISCNIDQFQDQSIMFTSIFF